MLPSALLRNRRRGDSIEPMRLPLDAPHRQLARELIAVFEAARGDTRGALERRLQALEGESTDYRLRRGLAHLLFARCEFQTVAPLPPEELRERVFGRAAGRPPGDAATREVLAAVAAELSDELGREVAPAEVAAGLHADLAENQRLVAFEAPDPEELLQRFNLAQAQGVLYRASQLVITAYRNEPGEYKQLFRYLKLFGLMAYIEGDADHGFTITIDGPASVLRQTTRYGLALAKFLPALLQVSRWSLRATLVPRRGASADEALQFTLESGSSGLVSHYKPARPFDSILEEALSRRWASARTEWKLEREVDLVPLPGSVMIPDFRLVHPDGRAFLFEIVGYWRPEYLRRKFAQVQRAGRRDLVLAVSERLNLARAGVDPDRIPVPVVWFKNKIEPADVLAAIE